MEKGRKRCQRKRHQRKRHQRKRHQRKNRIKQSQKMRFQKMQILKTVHKTMMKTFCTLINLKIEVVACNGTLLFAEDLAIEIAVKNI
jgi:hypothetical protein